MHLRAFLHGIFYFGTGAVVTKPRHQCVPPPGAIIITLEQAAAAISINPASYLKLQEAGYMPRARRFPLLKRKGYVLDEVRAAAMALPVDDDDDDDSTSHEVW